MGTYYSLKELVCNTIIEEANVPKRRPRRITKDQASSSAGPGRTGGRASIQEPHAGHQYIFLKKKSEKHDKNACSGWNAEDRRSFAILFSV